MVVGFLKQCEISKPACGYYFIGSFDSIALDKSIFGIKSLKNNPEKLDKPTPVLMFEALFEYGPIVLIL